MNTQFAGCDDKQSGQRFLDSSDPRLIRQVAPCETAAGGEIPLTAGKDQKLSLDFANAGHIESEATEFGPLEWDTYPQNAGQDQKLPQGFGDRVPDDRGIAATGIVAVFGAGSPSLDLITNNRHNGQFGVSGIPASAYARPLGRGKFCGRLSIVGLDPKTGGKKWRRLNCNTWNCSYCAPRRARTARVAIRRVAEALELRYFLTLTLDPSKVTNEKLQIPYLRKCFNKFREYLRRRYGVAPKFICVVELTQRGVPHLHILLDRFVPQRWISTVWSKLGGGRIVFIKQVKVQNVAKYLSKYLTKELLLSAPKGVRRITTARGIKLFPKFVTDMAWEVLKRSIYGALLDESMRDWTAQVDMFQTSTLTLEFDEEKFLKGFQRNAPILAT